MKKNLTNRACADEYRKGKEFTNKNSTLRGIYYPANESPSAWDSGRLSGDDLEEFRKGIRDSAIRYVIYSYATPIIWIYSDNVEYRVKQKFSVTTSKQSGLFYRYGSHWEVDRHFDECKNYETNVYGDCGGRLLQSAGYASHFVCEECLNRKGRDE